MKEFLRSQPVYSRFRPARKRYKRNIILANICGEVFQIDIMDMQKHVAENDGYKYAFIGYDTYSKYLTWFPLKNRKPSSIVAALVDLYNNLSFTLINIYWDREGSFLSHRVQNWLKNHGINNYTTTSDVKAAGAERAIRTIRVALGRHFVYTHNQRWINYLPIFVNRYNNRIHSTTKQKPLDIVNDPTLVPATRRQTFEYSDKK